MWMGNQMAGSDMSQKRKKHIKSRVVVPEDAGRWFAVQYPWLGHEWSSNATLTDIVDTRPHSSQHNQYA